jgi:hypothetical protein
MKAKIWKDRETGRWCFDVRGYGLRSAGDRSAWRLALEEALGDMRWIEAHRRSRRFLGHAALRCLSR